MLIGTALLTANDQPAAGEGFGEGREIRNIGFTVGLFLECANYSRKPAQPTRTARDSL